MKQHGDIRTMEAFPLPAKRGRKPTGKAKSVAERQALLRSKRAGELAALLSEVEALRAENAKLRADNREMAALLVDWSSSS